MINPIHISEIVNRTLTAINSKEPAMSKLIKATFAMESYLTDLYEGNKHGFMMMTSEDIEYTCKEHIQYKTNLKERIHATTGIDVSVEDVDTLITETDHNIAFMVCVLFGYYDCLGMEINDDSMDGIWRVYRDHYNKNTDVGLDDFTNTYLDVYVN